MPIELPPPLDFDGLNDDEAYALARESFVGDLLTSPVVDPLGRRVEFVFGTPGDPQRPAFCQPMTPPRYDAAGRLKDDCWHVCFKEAAGDHNRLCPIPRDVFQRTRAAHIPWIRPALTHPDIRIRESPRNQEADRQAYSTFLPRIYPGIEEERIYLAVVRNPRLDSVSFITAYFVGRRDVDKVRASGPQVYPPMPQKAAKKNRR